MNNINGCDNFLADVFYECEKNETNVVLIVILSVIFGGLGIGMLIFCYMKHAKNSGNQKELQQMAEKRNALVHNPTTLANPLELGGTYTENGQTQQCSYVWHMRDNGFHGEGRDDDGRATVEGKIQSRQVAWLESGSGRSMEVFGELLESNGQVRVTATYLSSYQGTRGSISVQSQPGLGVVVGNPVVGTVVK